MPKLKILIAALGLTFAAPALVGDWYRDRNFENRDRPEWRRPEMRYDRDGHLRDACPSFEHFGRCPEDKIVASKKKGMWMGGNALLGYDIKDRKLIVNEPEATTVQLIFKRRNPGANHATWRSSRSRLAAGNRANFMDLR
jgi:hypothetical protein